MSDNVGLWVGLGIVVILVVGAIVMQSRRGGSDDTINRHPDDTAVERDHHPEGAERSHLVGNPPVDTVTTQGWGVATPGEGAEAEELPEDVHPEYHEDPHRRRRH
jgi:hypothetical protein